MLCSRKILRSCSLLGNQAINGGAALTMEREAEWSVWINTYRERLQARLSSVSPYLLMLEKSRIAGAECAN